MRVYLIVICFTICYLAVAVNLQSKEEAEYPKLHKCVDLGEAYGAAYLTTKNHVVSTNISRDLRKVACEMASSVLLSTARRRKKIQLHHFRNNPSQAGLAIMSLDVLDYSVLHLSAYERSHRKFAGKLRSRASKEGDISPLVAMGRLLKERAGARHAHHTGASEVPEVYRTIVVMPFLGSHYGAGHSNLDNRYRYLEICFWSLYVYFPHISVGVISDEDEEYLLTKSGLPWYDVIRVSGPKVSALPMATIMEVQRRLRVNTPHEPHSSLKSRTQNIIFESTPSELVGNRDVDGSGTSPEYIAQALAMRAPPQGYAHALKKLNPAAFSEGGTKNQRVSDGGEPPLTTPPASWGKFNYVYYTESDQVLLVRILRDLYTHVNKYPRRMLLPHRLMPYPTDVISKVHGLKPHSHDRSQVHQSWTHVTDWNEDTGGLNTWFGSSCCLPRQNCIERDTWQSIKNASAVPIASVFDIQVPLGNSHFRIERYRGCKWRPKRVNQCP